MPNNNSIALQARAPQTNFMSNAVQKNAQMINMMRQQDVAERQAATAAKNAQIADAEEARAASKAKRDASAAEIELAGKQIDFYTKLAGQVMNANGYNMLLTRLDKDAPDIAKAFRANLPPEQFDRNMLLQMVGSIADNFKATYGPLETQVIQDADGNYGVATSGGFSAERGQQGVVPLNVLQPKTGTPPPAAGGSAPAGGLRPTRGANTTPADLRAQMAPAGPATPDRLEAAARAAARGARATDPIFDGLTDDEFRQMQTRADEIRGGGASMKPASFDGGAAQPDLGGIVQQMMQTGVVSQSNLQALRAAAGPDKEQQLAQILRSSNIKIMPDEGQAGGMRDAVYRPDEGMPTLQRTQGMVQYEDTGRQFKGKSPMQAPEASIPGAAKVPLKRVREEAQASEEGKVAGQTAADRVRSRAEQKRAAENFFRVVGMKPGDKNDPVANLIKRSTSGAIEAVGAELVGAIPESIGGGATEGAQAIGELQTIAAKLTNDLLGGKLGTGISNEDRKMIERLVGDIANPYIAADKRLAAWRRVKQIQASYLGAPSTPVQKRIVRTGTHNGRRVVQYADGSVDYAD
jgi:hypothetical protein